MQAPVPPQATGQAHSAQPQQLQSPAMPGSGGALAANNAMDGGGGGGGESYGAGNPWLLPAFERGKIPESAPPAMYC